MNLLDVNNIQIIEKVNDWQEAVRLSLKPLVEHGYCEERYIQGIFENTEKYGPYYVLCENLAFLHARPEQGALKTQFAVTLLKNPVKFKSDGFDVRVLIAMTAMNNEDHLKGMVAMAKIFTSNEAVTELINSTTKEQIYQQITRAV